MEMTESKERNKVESVIQYYLLHVMVKYYRVFLYQWKKKKKTVKTGMLTTLLSSMDNCLNNTLLLLLIFKIKVPIRVHMYAFIIF